MREVKAVVGHLARMLRQIGLHEGDGRRVELGVVQADVQFAVRDDGILV